MLKKITISNITFEGYGIKIFYKGEGFKYAWLENANKHIPDIINLDVNLYEKYVFIDLFSITKFHNFKNSNNLLKLSLSTDFTRSFYNISEDVVSLISKLIINDVSIILDKNNALNISVDVVNVIRNESNKFNSFDLINTGSTDQSSMSLTQRSNDRPFKIIVIGSCFSRSIFRSSQYFNPSYKQYFEVVYTSFHNSLISMMSCSTNNVDYKKFNDLSKEEIKSYVDMEFDKNIFEYIDRYNPDLIVFDNYIEATAPIINFSSESYLTYNKYFAESIFKRKFSNCEIIYPGTEKHADLLYRYMTKFSIELRKRKMCYKTILLGSRLSEKKINLTTGEIEKWSDKMEWIQSSNDNWAYSDHVFLKCIPNARYIDMRLTSWLSDNDSPIIGGASPSHYQSEYYKDIFQKLLNLTGYVK